MISEICKVQYAYLFYKKSAKGCAFGVSQGDSVIQAAWTTCYHALTETDKYCYMSSQLYPKTYANFSQCEILVEDGTLSSYRRGYATGTWDDKMVVLAPLTIPEEPYICRYAFIPTTFKLTLEACEFTMNDKNYVVGNTLNYDTSNCRFVLEL